MLLKVSLFVSGVFAQLSTKQQERIIKLAESHLKSHDM